jgi:hypothetical protein
MTYYVCIYIIIVYFYNIWHFTFKNLNHRDVSLLLSLVPLLPYVLLLSVMTPKYLLYLLIYYHWIITLETIIWSENMYVCVYFLFSVFLWCCIDSYFNLVSSKLALKYLLAQVWDVFCLSCHLFCLHFLSSWLYNSKFIVLFSVF